MKRFVVTPLVLLVLAASASAAWAFSQSSIPGRFSIPWASSAGVPYIRPIPQASQIGIQNGAASLTDGFPPLTFVPSTSGGVPPFGQDFNGILKQITQWSQWQAAGGPALWDSTFATAVGGYPSGALLTSSTVPGRLYWSNTDNNATDPNSGGANWMVGPRRASRVATASTDPVTTIKDFAIGFNRTAGVAATPVALPSGAVADQEFEFQDLAGNFNAFPVTFTPPGGQTIAGLTTYVYNVDRGTVRFRYYGSNIWGVKP